MGKSSRQKKADSSVRVTTVANPNESRSWFLPAVLGIVLVGAIGVALLAMNRESNTGVSPEALVDHWHTAFGVYECDTFQPATLDQNDPEGIHTHADGIIHVHPFRGTAAGNNATLGAFFRATGSELTDTTYTPGPSTPGEPLDEAAGCDGEPATLRIAYWDNALLAAQGEAPDVIEVDDLANFKFEGDISALTLALVPEGADIPPPPSIPNLQTLTDL